MILRENAFFFAGAAESLMPNGGERLHREARPMRKCICKMNTYIYKNGLYAAGSFM